MSGFADNTNVSPEKTKAEIEAVLRKYGADSFVSGWDADRAFVMFRARDRVIRFTVTMPSRKDRSITHTTRGIRTASQQQEAYEQAVRTYWRRLLLCIKAKLESVQSGIETFEEAFLAQIVLPDQTTVGQWAARAIPEAYATKDMPKRLLALGPAEESS
jgi:hypothetical protein